MRWIKRQSSATDPEPGFHCLPGASSDWKKSEKGNARFVLRTLIKVSWSEDAKAWRHRRLRDKMPGEVFSGDTLPSMKNWIIQVWLVEKKNLKILNFFIHLRIVLVMMLMGKFRGQYMYKYMGGEAVYKYMGGGGRKRWMVGKTSPCCNTCNARTLPCPFANCTPAGILPYRLHTLQCHLYLITVPYAFCTLPCIMPRL